MNEEVLRAVLDGVELRELPLLSWGVSDGSLTESELEALVANIAPGEDFDTVVDALMDYGLIFATGVTDQRFRSRMAETVRLAARLRQWFHGKPWATAPSLVSDLRFLSRPRTVPRRDVVQTELDAMLQASGAVWSAKHRDATVSLLGGRNVSAFQARAMLRLSQPHAGPRGTVIAAGTGSGKTLAFYLPALAQLAATPGPTGVPRIIAVYPRIELLRDQLHNLLVTCRALGDAAPNVGVLYGDVPKDRASAIRHPAWKPGPNGLLCPILTCLENGCGGRLVWPDAAGNTERLVCERCSSVVGPQTLIFTRDRLKATPPSILFATTEMINRELGSRAYRRVLVGDDSRSPNFLLLDEIHTYTGTHGAQVANLLRRWRAEVATPPHMVGLSATLADPIGFFADLTGLPTSHIAAVQTEPAEMSQIGREYFLALRGDPASQTSLLSTTIQASLLMRRSLDPDPGTPSGGTYGSKLFVFVDDLDVTNRLHAQLLDAEGWRSGGVNRKPNGSLATLRASTGPDIQARDAAGQLWRMPEDLGTLERPMRIARTTSRDSGVDASADVVVATASLEVGFDDPFVGAVIQHKAPRDSAQFVQRRGRAGRDPNMRPWTVVVLSDFGRDRLAFQSYDFLFDPVIPRVALPLKNRSILKMQATWWMLDRLSRSGSGTSVASVIEKPWSSRDSQREHAKRLLNHVREQLNSSALERMGQQLQRALSLTDEDLRAVLWDHPRGLIPSVIPSLIRGLEVAASELPPDYQDWPRPLAEFLPAALFSPLQTPEIEVTTPVPDQEAERESVSQGLRQFAPGRVSYRYARRGRADRLWVEPPLPDVSVLDLSSFCDSYAELEPPYGSNDIRVIQPRSLSVTTPPGTASDSSYGKWLWQVAFRHEGDPVNLEMPTGSPWATVVIGFQALTHRYRCANTVWRYAQRFTVERNADGMPAVTEHAVTMDAEPVAVGFTMDVDSLSLTVTLPEYRLPSQQLLQSLRVARTEFLIRSGDKLSGLVPSRFTREWLHQVLLSVLVVNSQTRSIDQTLSQLGDDLLKTSMLDAAREVFGVLQTGGSDEDTDRQDANLIADLSAALNVPGVIDEIRSAAKALSATPDDEWHPWLDERYLTTLASAVVEAIQSSCPEVDTSELRIDLTGPRSEGRSAQIIISEDEPGGLGVVEALVDRYVEDPRKFWALLETALGPSAGERIDENMRGFLARTDESQMAARLAGIRTASDLTGLTSAWQSMRVSLFDTGLACDHAMISALSSRLLRPGSSQALEHLIADLLTLWDDMESRLGVDIELRVFAYVAASDPDVRRRIQSFTGGRVGQAGWEIGQIVGLLWSRGYRVRSSALQAYSPFREYEPTERLLFAEVIRPPDQVVDGADSRWRSAVDERLREAATATIRTPTDNRAAEIVRELLIEPTNIDVLEFHPRIVGLSRSPTGLDIRVELREARQ